MILFGTTVFNVVLIWWTANSMPGACAACPWFYPWTYFNEPTFLFIAGLMLSVGRRWSDGIAYSLSGYLVVDLLYRNWIYDLSLIGQAQQMFSPYEEFVYAWQSQYILAFVIFIVAGSCLAHAIVSQTSAWGGLASK